MGRKTPTLPHERPENQKDWDDTYGEFTTIEDEMARRWQETHYDVHGDEIEDLKKKPRE